MFQDSRGRIWASTLREFGYLESERFIPLKNVPGGPVYSIREDSSGSLWIANKDHGLIHLLQSGQVQQTPWTTMGHEDYALALAVDPLRRGLWVGFYKGGIAYFADDQVRASYSTTDGLGEGRVNDLRFDPDGTLWAATEGGLSRLKNGRIATLSSKDGLPCDSAHWVMQDDTHSVWLYTTCGLVRVARSELDAWAAVVDAGAAKPAIHATVFDSSDGVRTLEDNGGYTPHVAKASDGKLWFLPSDGASVIDPHHLPFNRLPPPVHIERIIADRKTYSSASAGSGRLSLPALVQNLEIDYTALSLVAPEKVLFRYKLEDWDRDWEEAGTRRQAFYTHLSPGNYRFRVAACNNSGVWNEVGAALDFAVAPAYYQTAWFRLSSVAAVLALLALLYQLRLRQAARYLHIRMEERVNERTRIAQLTRPERHRQMDQHATPGHGHSRQRHRRGGLRPECLLRTEGRTCLGASKTLKGPAPAASRAIAMNSSRHRDALYCSKICAYAQGFQLMRKAQKEYNWKLNFAEIAAIFRGGCIIRTASSRRSPMPTPATATS